MRGIHSTFYLCEPTYANTVTGRVAIDRIFGEDKEFYSCNSTNFASSEPRVLAVLRHLLGHVEDRKALRGSSGAIPFHNVYGKEESYSYK